MKSTSGVGLCNVQEVYSGAEGELWELVMGQQIHIGGFDSSMDLAERAGVEAGTSGVDLCCCTGAGMRFLLRFRKVAKMTGVDATPRMIELGRQRSAAEGLDERTEFVQADVCASGLPDGRFDFAWGEDAWCYVENKPKLIAEAVRLVRPGGTVAFTDWVEGPTRMSAGEAERLLKFMKFPSIQDIDGYAALLKQNGCRIAAAENTGRFASYVDLYLNMLGMQLKYDALRIIRFDMPLMAALTGEMRFLQQLAHEAKIAQGLFVARKN